MLYESGIFDEIMDFSRCRLDLWHLLDGFSAAIDNSAL